ncbi:MAG: FHA domain-containing protein [Rhodococcus sp.]|nr:MULTISPECIES: FHA domain-containing protein [Rhodococcus]MCX6489356.1 FHA domain-containing protein [Rhodococcus sp. (in: high G+C Gram-positive bacteria)]
MLTRDLVTQLDQQIGTDILGLLPPGTALLVVKRGPTAGSRFLLDEPQVKAGRHPDSDIFLDDTSVSRRHATFTRTPDNRWLVSDSDSLNKVYVNRVAVDEQLLRTGDEIQLGKFRLVHLEPRIWTELSDTAKVNIVDLEEHPL